MSDLYITYSIRERYWVSKLVEILESEGYSVWWDHAVIPGHNFRNESQRALSKAKCALVVWSSTAVDDHWVLVDSEQANQQGILASIVVEDCEIPSDYQSLELSDLKDWKISDKQNAHLLNLLETIKTYCPPSQPSLSEQEQQVNAKLERMRAEQELKQQQRKDRELKMVRNRESAY
jgi:hypothetical protein